MDTTQPLSSSAPSWPAPSWPAPPAALQPEEPGLQPFLHDRCLVTRAPSLVVSGPDGQLTGPADGFFHQDRRVLSRLAVTARGVAGVPVQHQQDAGSSATFCWVLRGLGEHTADPAVTLERHRTVYPARFDERLVVANRGRQSVRLSLEIELAADFAPIDEVKAGQRRDSLPARAVPGGLEWRSGWDGEPAGRPGDGESGPSAGRSVVSARMEPQPDVIDAAGGRLGTSVIIGPGQEWAATLAVTVESARRAPFAPLVGPAPWPVPAVRGTDRRLAALVDASADDLSCLLLADPESAPGGTDLFLAAGAPWFLTLFGRDSLWAARMLLPLSIELARGTLRTLARRQGTQVDPETGEEPGKILHEIRPLRSSGDHSSLPPRYFGTIDATPLWLLLLRDAWRWGLAEHEVEQLLEPAGRALAWMRDHGDGDGDGLLEYLDRSGRGLANQGWRDSADSIRWHDGQLAEGPIALAEVQAYAYQAAWAGAELLDAFGRAGADEWRAWAERLKARFHKAFWIDGRLGQVPAVALDGHKRPVDSVTSGLGHLLGTGLLDPGQEDSVAAYLSAPELDSRFGLRTLGTDSVGFNPLGYHTGSVWPHDTAIAAAGLARAGHPGAAWSLIDGVLAAAGAFDYRLPELFAGFGRPAGDDPGGDVSPRGEEACGRRTPVQPADASGQRLRARRREAARPVPYPAACRPQAWAAAASVSFLQTLLGLEANAPAGILAASPLPDGPYPLRVSGLQFAGQRFDIEVAAGGRAQAHGPAGLAVRTRSGPAGMSPSAAAAG